MFFAKYVKLKKTGKQTIPGPLTYHVFLIDPPGYCHEQKRYWQSQNLRKSFYVFALELLAFYGTTLTACIRHGVDNVKDQDQDSLLVKGRNDNQSPGRNAGMQATARHKY